MEKLFEKLEEATVRFAGDSGDGIQVSGSQFTSTTVFMGNDVATFPDFPAEIRAPAGTTYGVSAFQVKFGSKNVHTPGDMCDVLITMNAAALKTNLKFLNPGGIVIVNSAGFSDKNLKLAGYTSNPLDDETLKSIYKLYPIDLTGLTARALEDTGITSKEVERCKNFLALGLMYWMFDRKLEPTEEWIRDYFAKKPEMIDPNIRALRAGFNFGITTEMIPTRYSIGPAQLEPGKYRNITGNDALAIGLVAAGLRAGRPVFLGSYPITPASDILHALSGYKEYGVKTFQAEDEIAAVTSVIGAAYAGNIGVTTTAGPGLALKGEALGLAVMVELPIIVVDVQRGGPSTGMPTKTEQSDLNLAMNGRHGEAPVIVIAAQSASDCFNMAMEAVRLATQFMTPVILLSDVYLGFGAEPWKLPNLDDMPDLDVSAVSQSNNNDAGFLPYLRDENFVRPWAVPGTPGLEHRIGGLEKQDGTGNVSYDPENHQHMVELRQRKIDQAAQFIPDLEIFGDADAELLVVGWGSTYGTIRAAVEHWRARGRKVAQTHFRYLNPLPKNTADILRRFPKLLVPEINNGQFIHILRAKFGVTCVALNKIMGQPFKSTEVEEKIDECLRA